MFKHVHHVHYVVENLDDMMAYFEENFGLTPFEIVEHPERKIREALFKVGPTNIQMSEPGDPNSGQGKFLKEHGSGVYHVAWAVDDVPGLAQKLQAKGQRLRNEDGITNSPLGYHTINIERDQTQGLWLQMAEGQPTKE
jgi:methylmalonyl-CoA/ethylmalonyl-CoA epimerase